MVDVTLLELNLEGADFTANAPFSGKKGKSGANSPVSKVLGRSSSSADDDAEEESHLDLDGDAGDSSSPFGPLLALGAVIVVLAIVRKLRRGESTDEQQELVEYEA
jgi:hypothetical protein